MKEQFEVENPDFIPLAFLLKDNSLLDPGLARRLCPGEMLTQVKKNY